MKFFYKNRKRIIQALSLVALVVPVFVFADSAPLVPCDGVTVPCDFGALMRLVNNVIQFVLIAVVPLAAIIFAYAGFVLLTSGGSDEKKGQAKKIFSNVAIGLVIVLAAWLIIETVIHALGWNGAWIGF